MVEEVVYVLGAGASYDAGGPLVRDFFSMSGRYDARIYPTYFENPSRPSDKKRYWLLSEAYSKWAQTAQTPNIESFFQSISDRSVAGRTFYDPITGNKISNERMQSSLIWYMCSYIRHSIAAQNKPPQHYADFAQYICKRKRHSVIISFNYDLVFENELIKAGVGVNYRLDEGVHYVLAGQSKKFYTEGIPFLKLHGSMNWWKCDKCDNFWVLGKRQIGHQYPKYKCWGNCNGNKIPVIIPPVKDKTPYLGPDNQLWKQADRMLSKADRIVIIGYSLPEIDTASQELLKHHVRRLGYCDIIVRSVDTLRNVANRLGLDTSISPLPFTPTPTPFREYVRVIVQK
jgi:NAD-dependent SIR2 family protein deacetylase